ncbi:hypothetical protein CMUS01_05846 [Colletotrichum musicola]|uniref:Uncharacterized protein n=1 Tax=Colletotrichum musicola TaxID=2175873 RepID=A0A8H6NJ32_9PEZI|nr:hypothetical protein CMUS01_05846 [Colletotrichum musicola]
MEPQPANDVPETTHDDTISLMILEYLLPLPSSVGNSIFKHPDLSNVTKINALVRITVGQSCAPRILIIRISLGLPSSSAIENPDSFKASDENNQPQPQTQSIITQ